MKNTPIAFFLLLLFLSQSLYAQRKGTLNIQLNAARFIFPNALTRAAHPAFSYLNGMQVGYFLSERMNLYVGGKRLDYSPKRIYGFSGAHRFRGGEVHLGVEFFEKQEKQVFLTFFSELFFERTLHIAFWGTDYSLFYEINHRKLYAGIAWGLNFHLKLNDRLFLVAGGRLNAGRADVKALVESPSVPFHEVYPNRTFSKVGLDLINVFGLRLHL